MSESLLGPSNALPHLWHSILSRNGVGASWGAGFGALGVVGVVLIEFQFFLRGVE
jgi:hypothetical protein